jgi:uncharacterized protein (DUF2062 family)
MSRRLMRKFAPNPETLRKQWFFRIFGEHLADVQIWSTSRRAITRAAGVGIAICFLPLPIHTLLAVVVAVIWRLNLPVLVAAIYVNNPLTIVPIFYGAYRVGSALVGQPETQFAFELSWSWLQNGLGPVWKPFLVGCLVCAAVLGYGTYLILEFAWRRNTLRKLRARRARVSR